ncbi:MAG: hypothetical protein GSR84_05390 [Desulfurococcales archaeon]|nr:hypothetical protein [Desulfurococcales archaeon]
MLKYTTVKKVNAPLVYCIRCIRDPQQFLSHSKYTYTVKKVDSEYEVVFRWVKWGMERFYKVRITVDIEDDRIVYRSTSDSPHYFKLELDMEEAEEDATRIKVRSEMKAGIMADLLGRKDYADFIEELVEKGIAGVARKMAEAIEEATTPTPACTDCLIYDSERGYCYAIRGGVDDPARPPCQGKFYLSRKLILGAEG